MRTRMKKLMMLLVIAGMLISAGGCGISQDVCGTNRREKATYTVFEDGMMRTTTEQPQVQDVIQEDYDYTEQVTIRKRKAAAEPGISDEVAKHILAGRFILGMTDKQVRASKGNPDRKNRSIGRWGVHEQWVYPHSYLYFENGILTSWQD